MPNLLGNDLQVFFRLDRSGDWPPVPSEGLHVEKTIDGTYRVLETPFFVNNVAIGDVVRAAPQSADGLTVLWAGERLSWGGHQTLRVTPVREGSTTTCTQVLAEFGALGLSGEELEEYRLVAFDIPPETGTAAVKALLLQGDRDQRWWFEEACVSASW